MIASTTHIETPPEWESGNDWDSHRPALYLSMVNNSRPVCEFGCGNGSTKLLHRYCKKHSHHFSSYETNEVYANNFKGIVTRMNDYDEVHLSEYPYRQGVLFIDFAPGELRKIMIEKHKDHADIIVVHDTEPGAEYVYGMVEILSTFKYRLDYQPEGKPHTTAVSNFINITEWIP